MDNPEKLATRRRKTKQKHSTICVGHHYAQTITNNVNKTRALLQTTRGKDEANIVFYVEIVTDITTKIVVDFTSLCCIVGGETTLFWG
jgi:hypothetical protein